MTINFSKYDLGLKKGDLKLVPHNEKWAEFYQIESARILERINTHLPHLKLHHIGSTAVKGICAKPIIDMLGEVDNVLDLDPFEQIFQNLGYEYKGEYGIPGRRYLTLYSEDKQIAYVHVHIFDKNSDLFRQHMMFRNVLNENAELRAEYEALKLSLVQDGTLRSNYSAAKAHLISRILKGS